MAEKQNLNRFSPLLPWNLLGWKLWKELKHSGVNSTPFAKKNQNKPTPQKNPQNAQTKQQKIPKDTNMDYELPKATNSMEDLTKLSNYKQGWILAY